MRENFFMSLPIKPSVGEVFNYFTVDSEAFSFYSGKRMRLSVWVLCVCGKRKIISTYNLRSGKVKSCGCKKNELVGKSTSTHGLTNNPIYNVFRGMKRRCYDKNHPNYLIYGKRGISICAEWLNNPKSFYDWAINNGWKKGLEIDRIDNNGNYEPSNCRWTTRLVNTRNRRTTKMNESLVNELRQLHKLGVSNAELKRKFKVSDGCIYSVVNKITWK